MQLIEQPGLEISVAVQLELPLEESAQQEDEATRLGRGASFAAGPRTGLFVLLFAVLYSLYRRRAA